MYLDCGHSSTAETLDQGQVMMISSVDQLIDKVID